MNLNFMGANISKQDCIYFIKTAHLAHCLHLPAKLMIGKGQKIGCAELIFNIEEALCDIIIRLKKHW